MPVWTFEPQLIERRQYFLDDQRAAGAEFLDLGFQLCGLRLLLEIEDQRLSPWLKQT
jgi:hypothetical protein